MKKKLQMFTKKTLSIASAAALTLTGFTTVSADSLTDANVLMKNKQYDAGYTYINTYYKSAYNGKSAFKITYEYLELDGDGKYTDRDTNQEKTIDYSDTFEFMVFDTNWGGWNATKAGQSSPVVGTTYTATVQISTIESKLAEGSTVQGINFETGRIGDTKVKINSLEYVNDSSLTSSPAEFTCNWQKNTGGDVQKTSGTGTITADQWKIDISNICAYNFKNPTIDVTVDYGSSAPNSYLQAEVLNAITGDPIVENYPLVKRTGSVTYTTEFNKNLTAMSVCYDGCTVKSIKIYDNTVGDVAADTLITGKTATQTATSMGVAWNLGNALDCVDGAQTVDGQANPDYGKVDETCWGNPVTTKKLIQAAKAKGFNTVRIPVSYIDKINSDNTVDDDYLARVKQVVDYAYDMGMYVVINMHNDGGNGIVSKWLDITKTGDDFTAVKTKYAAVWSDIATYFKDYDQRLVFEGFNELMNGSYSGTPTDTQFANVNALSQAFVTAVRGAGSRNTDRVLIVAGYNTNIDQTVAHFSKPTDTATNRLMLSVHYYDPYDFTLNENSSVDTWGTAEDIADMESQIKAISDFGTSVGMPVFIGEYGPIDKNNTDARGNYCYYLNYYAAKNYIVTAYWDNGVTDGKGSALLDRTANQSTSTGDTIISKIISGYSDGVDDR